MSEEKKPRKIAIVGTAEPHWRAAPFGDPEWEIWTCGGIFSTVPRTDRHIEIHDKAETCKGWGQSPEHEEAARNVYWDWIREKGPAAVLKQRLPETPAASEYPLQEVLKAFPDRYFTNSVSYMLALALLEGCDELGLWGIDMALNGDPAVPESNEYARQRPSVEFYLGIACGRGIRVHIPAQSTLLKARRLYGFDGPEQDKFNALADAKVQELTSRRNQMRAQMQQMQKDLTGAEWGLEVAQYMAQNLRH